MHTDTLTCHTCHGLLIVAVIRWYPTKSANTRHWARVRATYCTQGATYEFYCLFHIVMWQQTSCDTSFSQVDQGRMALMSRGTEAWAFVAAEIGGSAPPEGVKLCLGALSSALEGVGLPWRAKCCACLEGANAMAFATSGWSMTLHADTDDTWLKSRR